MSFSTEIWNPALNLKKPNIINDLSPPAVSGNSSTASSSGSSVNPALPPKRNLLYRIFHFHDTNPQEMYARPRRSYLSDSDVETDSDSEHPSLMSKSLPRTANKQTTDLRKAATEKKNKFHLGSSASDSGKYIW